MKSRKRTKTIEMNEEMDNLEDINMNEVTDSEDEYSENERKLLQKVRNNRPSEDYDSDYEVYGLQNKNEKDQDDTEDEEEADSMVSDIEGLQEDFDLPNEKAWGKKKKAYYSTDYVDPDYATTSQKDLADAEMEEEEAKNIQKRLAEQLDDADFGLDFIQTTKAKNEEIQENAEQFVKTDLSKLSKRQKQAIMEKESPEFIALVNDYKDRMTEVRDVLAPFLKLAKSNILNNCPAVSFVKTKYDVLLNYCINISFYLMLKAKRLPVTSHPVIKRLAQYSQLLNQLESGQENLIQEIKEILKAKEQGKPLYNVSDGSKISIDKKKISNHFKEKLDHLKKPTKVEVRNKRLLESEYEMESKEFLDEEEHSDDNVSINKVEDTENNASIEDEKEIEGTNMDGLLMESEGKRGITYQIAKNKGLTPHRRKDQRNPRVKHRNKYRKAKIRRKGAVREVRKEITRYAGEISGIKASVKKSIKLK
ncbi:UTP3 small subunit processome component Sas10 [Nomia melanderi]|uniref:UTP3 small subunit processome component Sas10 n=1 Tax=Nomia melanderi TaxID=2448451 RepID=UPI0013043D6C|nr:something about silencing protein 10 [Nomia melanderi]